MTCSIGVTPVTVAQLLLMMLMMYWTQASQVEKYEKEVTRLKEKLLELEFYKVRVDELRADSSSLLDANQLLTDQLAVCHKRIETVVDLESDLQKYKQQLASAAEVKWHHF